jgi:hypothetical protein
MLDEDEPDRVAAFGTVIEPLLAVMSANSSSDEVLVAGFEVLDNLAESPTNVLDPFIPKIAELMCQVIQSEMSEPGTREKAMNLIEVHTHTHTRTHAPASENGHRTSMRLRLLKTLSSVIVAQSNQVHHAYASTCACVHLRRRVCVQHCIVSFLSMLQDIIKHKAARLLKPVNLIPALLQVAFGLVCEPYNEDDDSSATPQYIGVTILDAIMAHQHIPKKDVFPIVLARVGELVHSADPDQRKGGFVTMAVMAEGCGPLVVDRLETLVPIACAACAFTEANTVPIRMAACIVIEQFADHLHPDISQYHQVGRVHDERQWQHVIVNHAASCEARLTHRLLCMTRCSLRCFLTGHSPVPDARAE